MKNVSGFGEITKKLNQPRAVPAPDRVAATEVPLHPALQATIQAARHHGIELDPAEYKHATGETRPTPAALSMWAQNAGFWSRAVRLRWRDLFRFQDTGPVVLLLTDGGAALLVGSDSTDQQVYLTDPTAPPGAAAVAMDQLRLSQNWAGEALLLRAVRTVVAADAQFNFRWLVAMVLHERRSLRDICLASLTISVLTIFPPLLVMATVNKVLQFHSTSTLVLLSVILAIVFFYETLLELASEASYFDVVRELTAMASIFLPSDDDAEALFPGWGLSDLRAIVRARRGLRGAEARRQGRAGPRRSGETANLHAHKVEVAIRPERAIASAQLSSALSPRAPSILPPRCGSPMRPGRSR